MPLSILTQQVHAVGGWVIGPLSVRPVVLEYALQLERRFKCPQFSDCSIPVPLTLIGLCRSRYTAVTVSFLAHPLRVAYRFHKTSTSFLPLSSLSKPTSDSVFTHSGLFRECTTQPTVSFCSFLPLLRLLEPSTYQRLCDVFLLAGYFGNRAFLSCFIVFRLSSLCFIPLTLYFLIHFRSM